MSRKLPVWMPSVPGQRWSCAQCTYCCRALTVHLFADDRARLEAGKWRDKLGREVMVRVKGQWVLAKKQDGSCVFLDGDACTIHRERGEAAKPLACRLFPFSLHQEAEVYGEAQVHATLRFDCPTVCRSEGASLESHQAALRTLAGAAQGDLPVPSATTNFQPGREASARECHAVDSLVLTWVQSPAIPFVNRLVALGRLVEALADARLARAGEAKLVQAIELLGAELPHEAHQPVAAPARRQAAMFRQSVYSHTESVTLEELRYGFLKRLRKRGGQLLRARRYLAGRGVVPPVRGLCGHTTFERVEAVTVSPEAARDADDLLTRYLAARITGASVYGAGYYGWPVVYGYAALCLCVAGAGYLARVVAAAEGRDTLAFDDVARALGVMDRAASRLPVLGTSVERMRVSYFWNDDGLARLLRRYVPA